MYKRILIAMSCFLLFTIRFIPISLPILIIFVVKMVITADEFEKNNDAKSSTKYFFISIIYLLVFLLIYFYLRFNKIYLGEFKLF